MNYLNPFSVLDLFNPRHIVNPSAIIDTAQTIYKRTTKPLKPLKEMDREKEKDLYASISRQAYKPNRNEKVRGYEYVPNESTKKRAVYKDPSSGHFIVAERGTDTSDPMDLNDDISIVKGKLKDTSRHINESRWLNNFQKKHGDNITLTGHSLGSNHAKLLAIDSGLPMVGFSEGTAPTVHSLGEKLFTKDGNIRNYNVSYDPISGLNPFSINVKPKEGFIKDPHALDHFIDASIEEEELKEKLTEEENNILDELLQ